MIIMLFFGEIIKTMKKIIISLAIVVMLFGSVANAQTVSREELESQYKALLVQVIQLLMKQVAELQAQLVVLQAQQAVVVQPTQSAPVVSSPVPAPKVEEQIAATSTPAVEAPQSAPQRQYNPTIKLEIVGAFVEWQAAGEPFECKLNGELVNFEGRKPTNGQTSFNLLCVGKETGTKLEKIIQ